MNKIQRAVYLIQNNGACNSSYASFECEECPLGTQSSYNPSVYLPCGQVYDRVKLLCSEYLSKFSEEEIFSELL